MASKRSGVVAKPLSADAKKLGDARSDLVTVADTLEKLRLQVLSATPGELLGSEDSLAQNYGVSRPTMRQVVVLLCQEGLMEARRGPRGGFFAKRPDARAIIHNTSIYLRTQETPIDEIIRAAEMMRTEMTGLAAANREAGLLDKWIAFRERDRSRFRSGKYHDYIISEGDFHRLLGEACGNRVLKLFMNTLNSLGGWDNTTEVLLAGKPERFMEYWKIRSHAVDSIIERDPVVALIRMRRGMHLLTAWTLADLGNQPAAEEEWSRAGLASVI
jgi:DNA-binding FadR family transcriptional regulator